MSTLNVRTENDFLISVITKYNVSNSSNRMEDFGSSTLDASNIVNDYDIPVLAYVGQELKNNTCYTIHSETDIIIGDINNSRIDQFRDTVNHMQTDDGMARTFQFIILKESPKPIPVIIGSRIVSNDIFKAKIYKDPYGRIIDIPLSDIKEIRAMTLTTIRSLKRACNYKTICNSHFNQGTTEFKIDDI